MCARPARRAARSLRSFRSLRPSAPPPWLRVGAASPRRAQRAAAAPLPAAERGRGGAREGGRRERHVAHVGKGRGHVAGDAPAFSPHAPPFPNPPRSVRGRGATPPPVAPWARPLSAEATPPPRGAPLREPLGPRPFGLGGVAWRARPPPVSQWGGGRGVGAKGPFGVLCSDGAWGAAPPFGV